MRNFRNHITIGNHIEISTWNDYLYDRLYNNSFFWHFQTSNIVWQPKGKNWRFTRESFVYQIVYLCFKLYFVGTYYNFLIVEFQITFFKDVMVISFSLNQFPQTFPRQTQYTQFHSILPHECFFQFFRDQNIFHSGTALQVFSIDLVAFIILEKCG